MHQNSLAANAINETEMVRGVRDCLRLCLLLILVCFTSRPVAAQADGQQADTVVEEIPIAGKTVIERSFIECGD